MGGPEVNNKSGEKPSEGATPPRVLVLAVTYNVEAWICQLLESLQRQDYSNFDVCVRDDASSDRTVEVARTCCNGKVRVVTSSRNMGRCAAINSVLPLHPRYKYLILLNAAAVPERDFLSRMVAFADARGQTFGGAIPQIVNRESLKPYVSRPTRGFGNFVRNTMQSMSNDKGADDTINSWFQVDSFWGCACILNAKMADDLRFDEELGTFSEEEDLANRAAKSGYRFYWTNSTHVLYKMGVSTMDERGVTPFRMYFGLRNRIYVALKYYERLEASAIITTAIVYSLRLSLKRPTLLRYYFRAIGWNLHRLPSTLGARREWRTRGEPTKT